MSTITAQAFANIAFIKYLGNRDNILRLPMNGSISMNLDGVFTRTRVSFRSAPAYAGLGRDFEVSEFEGMSRII